MMSKINSFLGIMRAPFLILTPACVALGLGTAVWTTGTVNWGYFTLALIGALAAHISVNALNEYFDFKSGLDAKTVKTPFSGGSGTLPARPELASYALVMGLVALAVVGLIGVFFLTVRGWALLPLGLLGMAVIAVYTGWITRYPLLCLIAPGLGFGPLMVMGTHFVLSGEYSWTALAASAVPFFLVSDLLLLNQFPDVEADRSIGRRHLPIAAGRLASSWVYGVFLLAAYLVILAGVVYGRLPAAALIGLVTMALAVPAFWGARRYAENIQRLGPYMGLNVLINVATPLLVAAGLLFSR